jgi:hypothetical protein
MLTVETKVNGDSKRTNERGPSLGWFVELVVPVQEIFVLLFGCSSRPPVQNIFFLAVRYSHSFVPIAQQAGQADVLGRLSLSMCL